MERQAAFGQILHGRAFARKGGNMSNLNFEKDGPIEVSEDEVCRYKELDLGTVTDAYFVWINEGYSDGVRRLALREAIRHHATRPDGSEVAHCLNLSCGGFAMQKDPSLEQVLRLRPKLLAELTEELDYCRTHSMELYGPELDFMIEMILKVAGDTDDAKRFWSSHSLAGYVPTSKICELLQLCQPGYSLPEWVFKEKVWPGLEKRALDDIGKPSSYYEDSQLKMRCVALASEGVALSKLCDYLENAHIYATSSKTANPRNIQIAEQVADFLDTNLPKSTLITWHLESIINTIELFTDSELAYRFMRRHLLQIPLTNEKGSPTVCRDQKSWFWLYGLVMHVAPEDKEFLDRIEEFINLNAGELQLEYH